MIDELQRRFWTWWWWGGKDLTREIWYRVQMLIAVTFLAILFASYLGWWF